MTQPSLLTVLLVLSGLIAFVIFFSLTIFTNTSLRLDEAQSLFQTNRDVGGILNLVAQDVHVPGYHILLHYWQVLFGNDIHTARLMSLVFFVATIPAVYLLASYAFNSRSMGLYTALLVAISPFMDWYGSEARMYSMLAFLTVVHQYFFLKLYREGKSVHWVWYTITAVLGIYTHYFFGFVLLTEVIMYFFLRKEFAAPKAFIKFLIAGGVVVLSIIPWLWYVVRQGFASNTQPALTEPTSVDLFNTYAQFIFGFQTDALNTMIVSLWPLIVLLAFFALQKNRSVPKEAMYFAAAAIIPVIGAFIVSVTVKPFFQSRYLIVALPALLIFITWVASAYPRRVSIVLKTLLVVIIAGLFTVQAVSPNTPVKEDYRDAVAHLSKNATSRDVIILSAPFTIYPTEYYYRGDAKLTTQPVWDRFSQGAVPTFDEKKLPSDIKRSTDSYQNAWVMLSYDQGYNEKIRKYMDGHYERTSSHEFSKNLWVYSYKIRYDPGVTLAE